jgi:hypothetical protein
MIFSFLSLVLQATTQKIIRKRSTNTLIFISLSGIKIAELIILYQNAINELILSNAFACKIHILYRNFAVFLNATKAMLKKINCITAQKPNFSA